MPPLPALAVDEDMAGVALQTASLREPGPALRTSEMLPLTGLTAVALAALALGLVLLLLPGIRLAPEIPPFLFAVALAMLILTLLLSRDGRSYPSSVGSAEATDAVRETRPAVSSSAASPTPTPPPRNRVGVPGRGSAWRILSSPTEPGDETWLSWLPRESRRLGPEAASLAPGVLSSPGRAGNLVAFPVRDYFGGALPPARRGTLSSVPPRAKERGIVGDEHLPALSSSRASPFSEAELDRMFPPAGRRGPVFLDDVPDRIGGSSPWTHSGGSLRRRSLSIGDETSDLAGSRLDPDVGEDIALAAPQSRGRGAESSKASSSSDSPGDSARNLEHESATNLTELRHEAANPVPPHLRASGTLLRFEPSPRSGAAKGSSAPRSVCASCSNVVVDLRLSGPCPKCLRPLCQDCLREALVTVGHGWCTDCAQAASAS